MRIAGCFRPGISWRGVLLVAMLAGLTGCYEQHVRVIVFPDGSGRIVLSRYFPAATVRLMTGMQSSMGGGMADGIRMEEAFYSEARFKREARSLFGRGVRFVSAQRAEVKGGRGSVALFAFDKVDGLILSTERMMQQSMAAMEGGGYGEDDEDDLPEDVDADGEDEDEMSPDGPGREAYRLVFIPGASPRLVVKGPKRPEAAGMGVAADAEYEQDMMMASGMEDAAESQQAIRILMAGGNPLQLTGSESMPEVMNKLCRSLRITLEVEVRGATATVAASHPDPLQPGRCTLLSVDGEALSRDETMRKKIPFLMEMGMGGGSSWSRLAGKPGVKIESRPEVVFILAPPAGR